MPRFPLRRLAPALPILLGIAVPPALAEPAGAAADPPALAEGPEYQRCLDQVRDDPEAALRTAQAWELAGGEEGARHCHALALLAQGEAAHSAEQLEALASRSRAAGEARAIVFAQAGQAWMQAEQPGRAFAAITMGLILTPHDVELLTDRVLVLGALGRYAEATEDLDQILALSPDRVDALVLRAAARRRMNQSAEAEADVEHALALAPDNPEALLERGILRQLRGDTAGAKADWQRVVALAPEGSATSDLAHQNLVLNQAGQKRR